MNQKWKYIAEKDFVIQYNYELEFLEKNKLREIAYRVFKIGDKWDSADVDHGAIIGDNFISYCLTDKRINRLLVVIDTKQEFEKIAGMKISDLQRPERTISDGQNKVSQVLDMFVITTKTSDFGDKFVIRKHEITNKGTWPTTQYKLADSLEEARKLISDGKVCIPRDKNDDPVIVESWI